jgi:DnaK suppressor protein
MWEMTPISLHLADFLPDPSMLPSMVEVKEGSAEMSNRSLASTARKMLLRRGRSLLRLRHEAPSKKSGVGPDYLAGLSDREQQELGEIHAALERIERGIYGRCDRCFCGVERDRLESVPWERYCDACRESESAGAGSSLPA